MADPRRITFSDADLYDRNDPRPRARDISQDAVGDCYLMAPMGSLAELQPDRIRQAIRYDQATGNFQVTLYRNASGVPTPETITVTQDALRDNLRRNGGSGADNALQAMDDLVRQGGGAVTNDRYGVRDNPIWPAVIETAAAIQARQRGGRDGLDEGYRWLQGNVDAQGNPFGAVPSLGSFTLTGDYGHFQPAPPPAQANEMARDIEGALARGQPVTLATMQGREQDGLADGHAYMVEGVTRNRNGEAILQLRNPWGHNNVGESRDSNSPTLSINLREALDQGGIQGYHTGPGRQQPDLARDTPSTPTNAPSRTGNPHVNGLLDAVGDPAAMRHAMTALAQSPDGQTFRAEGQALWQAQQSPAQTPRSHEPIALPSPNEEPAPRVMRMQ